MGASSGPYGTRDTEALCRRKLFYGNQHLLLATTAGGTTQPCGGQPEDVLGQHLASFLAGGSKPVQWTRLVPPTFPHFTRQRTTTTLALENEATET